jgi:uncharacterized protein involved in exopolysaccharide biosynthesis
MKRIAFLVGSLLMFTQLILPLRADPQPTAYEKALYDKSRYSVLSRLSDEDFVSYCVTMNVGGDTLLKFHDQILAKQTARADLIAQGLTAEHPQVMAIDAELRDLRAQYQIKIAEARKGLEVEASIAESTLMNLPQASR